MTEVLPAMGDVSMSVSHAPLRSSSSHTSFFESPSPFRTPRRNSYSFSDLRPPAVSSPSLSSSQTSSAKSSTASSLSLDTRLDDSSSDDELSLPPSYCDSKYKDEEGAEAPPSSPLQTTVTQLPTKALASTPEQIHASEDDTAVRPEPSQHVDYLSHVWKEEDIWSSWRHIVAHRSVYGERSRLENASWRQWAKQQFNLKTITPESLDWLKEADVSWLYGPLQPASDRLVSLQNSEPSSRLSKTNSFLHKKPILKKRSMSEVMLQKSISTSSLVKQAAAAVQAQQASGLTLDLARKRRPMIGRASSDYTPMPSRTISRDTTEYFSSSRSSSGLQTPDQSEKRHIRFDEKVEQCIAVECKGADDDEEEEMNHNPWAKYRDDDSSSDEGVVMMKKSRKRRPLSRTSSKVSITGDSVTIAKLPSTTLKTQTDSTEANNQHPTHSLGSWRSNRLSPSPSQETLRPRNPSTNYLLPDDDDNRFTFNSSRRSEGKRASTPTPSDPYSTDDETDSAGLRRTESGMFMPFEDEDDNPSPPGILGRVVDTVNTARDIAHVIWNVGWKK
ncbi:hypothetical protein CC80DRAFT_581913 [Byssothecium circinans]|uniref:Nitrogen regulatory protein areA GATA-like domain-containing protein n=1 Tax=Byssothecium circinans TaxID=147558 RepID=A0A6A5T9Z9_9PLEO|nr:hypothetical protein CC80DRAFT_581913 [Byssothecium circinans]